MKDEDEISMDEIVRRVAKGLVEARAAGYRNGFKDGQDAAEAIARGKALLPKPKDDDRVVGNPE